LLNVSGERFMSRYEAAGELAPRDRVARAIVRESQRTGGQVFLSMEHLDPEFVHERFPLISKACRDAGLDLARDRIPVGPAAHYVMGGVLTDLDGRTSLPGLYAAGEVACTGVHGANRLASNSLLEGLVFGARAGRAMRTRERDWPVTFAVQEAPSSVESSAAAEPASASVVQDVMWRRVGLFRDRDGLLKALAVLERAWQAVQHNVNEHASMTADAWRTASITAVARLIARAALRREESRGAHYRTDFPRRDDVHWLRRVSEAR
jgi:L-aspartate oxidase